MILAFVVEAHDKMTGAYIALLIGALSASFVLRDNLRGILWLGLGQLVFWTNILYWDLSLPLPMLFVAICDASIVYAIYVYGKEKWEEWVMLIFVGSILTSFAAQAMVIINEGFNIYSYSWALYILNWIAVIIVGTMSGFKKAGYGRDFVPLADWSTFLGRERIVERKTKRV